MKQNKKRVAVTGGIGSGKSEVMKILSSFRLQTVSCDKINAELITEPSYISKIEKEFPAAVKDGKIDKRALAAIIFDNNEQRMKLNSIAHPIIIKRLSEIIEDASGDIYAEVPVLNEGNFASLFDEIWVVKSDDAVRAERLALRDGISLDYARQKIAAQNKKHVYSVPTVTINNDFNLENLAIKVNTLIYG